MTVSTNIPRLFSPIKLGDVTLGHRVVMAPLTRYRANKAHVHTNLALEYYAQRASVPGGLIITEATFIAQQAGGEKNVPGIWNDEQIAAWKRITEAVHEKGCYIYMQLWALGRSADPDVLKGEDPNLAYVSSSDVPLENKPCSPRPLTAEEIKEYIKLYAQAASNAVHRAGFDGVEVHGANGYLIDQFLQTTANKRTDEYGGSVENRCRFALEIVEAVVKEVGTKKTGMRLSPWGQSNGMGMPDPRPTFSYLVEQLVKKYPTMAYLHVIEPRVHGSNDRQAKEGEGNDFLREIWLSSTQTPRVFISAGGYERDTALDVAERNQELIAFGRMFISNPDLPYRLLKDLPLEKSNRDTYYKNESPEGYVDYPRYIEIAN